MLRGFGCAGCGALSSSSMISLHSSMHSSQMYTPGPATSFRTCSCVFPQKEHFRRSRSSPDLNMLRLLVAPALPPAPLASRLDHVVNEPVLLRLGGAHPEVALRVPLDPLQGLPGVLVQNLGDHRADHPFPTRRSPSVLLPAPAVP